MACLNAAPYEIKNENFYLSGTGCVEAVIMLGLQGRAGPGAPFLMQQSDFDRLVNYEHYSYSVHTVEIVSCRTGLVFSVVKISDGAFKALKAKYCVVPRVEPRVELRVARCVAPLTPSPVSSPALPPSPALPRPPALPPPPMPTWALAPPDHAGLVHPRSARRVKFSADTEIRSALHQVLPQSPALPPHVPVPSSPPRTKTSALTPHEMLQLQFLFTPPDELSSVPPPKPPRPWRPLPPPPRKRSTPDEKEVWY